jgi:hypothetical protein
MSNLTITIDLIDSTGRNLLMGFLNQSSVQIGNSVRENPMLKLRTLFELTMIQVSFNLVGTFEKTKARLLHGIKHDSRVSPTMQPAGSWQQRMVKHSFAIHDNIGITAGHLDSCPKSSKLCCRCRLWQC